MTGELAEVNQHELDRKYEYAPRTNGVIKPWDYYEYLGYVLRPRTSTVL